MARSDLMEGLHTKLTDVAGNTYAQLGNRKRVWPSPAPEQATVGTNDPLVIYQMIFATPEHGMGAAASDYYEDWQFTAYATLGSTARNVLINGVIADLDALGAVSLGSAAIKGSKVLRQNPAFFEPEAELHQASADVRFWL